MTSADLTSAQLRTLRERAARDLAYYCRLRERMDALTWEKSCLAYLAAVESAGALSDLVGELQRRESEILGACWPMLKEAGK